MIYTFAKKLAPVWVKRPLLKAFLRVKGLRNRHRKTADVFAEVYSSRQWGGVGEYSSGSGTEEDRVARPYLAAVLTEIERLGMAGKRFVDLGCGDFRVGSQLAGLAGSYVGVDVVPPLIEHHTASYGNERVSFLCMDIIDDTPPEGDICFVRQVLQHLSNEQIRKILTKFRAYKHVFITEHIPDRSSSYTPNLDKAQGPDIRLSWNSGIFLDQPPFLLPSRDLREILSVPGTAIAFENPGEIVTWIYTPPTSRD